MLPGARFVSIYELDLQISVSSAFQTVSGMWRSLFLALGITAILSGAQLFFVEQLEIKRIRGAKPTAVNNNNNFNGYQSSPFQQASYATPQVAATPATFLYKPKDWMPWSLLAVGAIVMIYTFTIPRRSRYSE